MVLRCDSIFSKSQQERDSHRKKGPRGKKRRRGMEYKGINRSQDNFLEMRKIIQFCELMEKIVFTFFSFFFASNDKEGAGTEPEPEIIMGPIHIFKQYLKYFLLS